MATTRDNREVLRLIFLALTIIGAINWGLVGFFNFNLVDAIFGGGAREQTSALSRLIYALVGLSGLATLFFVRRHEGTGMVTRRRSEVRP